MLAVLRVAPYWELATAVSAANETVNRGSAILHTCRPARSALLVYFVYFVVF